MKTLYFFLLALFAAVTAFSQQDNLQPAREITTVKPNVALSVFTAAETVNGVELSWTALNETNMVSHEIQKSANGSSFTSVGTVVAQNNVTPFRYTFNDATPVASNNYYRLRSIDKTGNVVFSDIIKVDNGFRKTAVMVLPNPVKGGVLNLQLANFSRGKYVISLYSNAGEKVLARSMDFSDGSSTETINLPQNITRGYYFLQVTDGVNRINTQVIVQ